MCAWICIFIFMIWMASEAIYTPFHEAGASTRLLTSLASNLWQVFIKIDAYSGLGKLHNSAQS